MPLFHSFVKCIAPALVLSALIVLTPRAASAADSTVGKLIIAKAEFGDLAGDKTLDVTVKIAALVKDNSLSVDATTSILGTPPGAGARKLKVSYTIDGLYRSKTVAEGETLDISTRLVIRKAVYGALPKGPSGDVTEEVAAMVKKNVLSVQATNELFGDTANGIVKKLRVDYTFDGIEKTKTVGENQTLTIPDKGK